MKTKLLLLGACAFFAVNGYAQTDGNLLKNGGFEEPYTTFNHADQQCPEVIEGWDLKRDGDGLDQPIESGKFNNIGQDEWNTFAFIKEIQDADLQGVGADLIADDNYQYLRFQRYDWNGWFDSDGIQQTVEVVPGQTYSLSCIYRVNAGGTRDKQDAKRHIRVYEASTNSKGGIVKGALIFEEKIPHVTCDWTAFSTSGIKTDSETKMIICLGMDGAGGEGDGKPQNENVYIDYDEVVFQKGGASGLTSMDASKISVRKLGLNILIDGSVAGDKVAVYDVAGNLQKSDVAQSDKLIIPVAGLVKGVYIVKVGNVTKKVVL
ncbi:T9SS type A sorting domain-containing protein [Bacteroides sp.]